MDGGNLSLLFSISAAVFSLDLHESGCRFIWHFIPKKKTTNKYMDLYRNGIHSHLPVHVGSVFNYINARTNARRVRNVRLFPYTSRYIAMTAPPLTLFSCAARLLGMGKPDAVVFFEPAIVLLNNQIAICLLSPQPSLMSPRFERLP